MKNKVIKKICGLLGYRLIDKKLFKNNRLISSYSFLSVNRILNNIFQNNEINSLVQIGANDGVRFDSLNKFINKYKINCLLVEPIQDNFEKLIMKYKNSKFVKLENSAISTNNEISFLYKVNNKYLSYYDDHIPGITSFDKNHLLNHGVKKNHIVIEKINSITVKELTEKHNIKNIDLFYVDAEGYDGKIVIDLLTNTSFKPIIFFEYIHIDNEILYELLNKLHNFNFKIFPINENIICYPESKKIEIDS
jgi:FkbM family methyltransferase